MDFKYERELLDCIVFWDIQNVPVPNGIKGYEVQRLLREILLYNPLFPSSGTAKSIKDIVAVGSIESISTKLRQELEESNITVVDCASTKVGSADISIVVEIMKFIYYHPPPYQICLASSDRDFAKTLYTLVSFGYEVVLIHRAKAAEVLKAAAMQSYEWEWLWEHYSSVIKHRPAIVASNILVNSLREGHKTRIITQSSRQNSSRELDQLATDPESKSSFHRPIKMMHGKSDTEDNDTTPDSVQGTTSDGMSPEIYSSPGDISSGTLSALDSTRRRSSERHSVKLHPPVPTFKEIIVPKVTDYLSEAYSTDDETDSVDGDHRADTTLKLDYASVSKSKLSSASRPSTNKPIVPSPLKSENAVTGGKGNTKKPSNETTQQKAVGQFTTSKVTRLPAEPSILEPELPLENKNVKLVKSSLRTSHSSPNLSSMAADTDIPLTSTGLTPSSSMQRLNYKQIPLSVVIRNAYFLPLLTTIDQHCPEPNKAYPYCPVQVLLECENLALNRMELGYAIKRGFIKSSEQKSEEIVTMTRKGLELMRDHEGSETVSLPERRKWNVATQVNECYHMLVVLLLSLVESRPDAATVAKSPLYLVSDLMDEVLKKVKKFDKTTALDYLGEAYLQGVLFYSQGNLDALEETHSVCLHPQLFDKWRTSLFQ